MPEDKPLVRVAHDRLRDGKPLFPAGHGRQDLDLTDLTRYDNGVVALTYERKDGAR